MSSTAKLVVRLIKFARAVTQGTEQVSWQETEDASLALILQPSTDGDPNSETSLHVMQGTTILEVINIGRRCQASLDVQRRSFGPPEYDRLPIYGTVLRDLFGIRYPLAAGKVYRIRMKLASLADCQTLQNACERLGMMFRPPDAPAAPSERPDTAPDSTSHRRRESLGPGAQRESAQIVQVPRMRPSVESLRAWDSPAPNFVRPLSMTGRLQPPARVVQGHEFGEPTHVTRELHSRENSGVVPYGDTYTFPSATTDASAGEPRRPYSISGMGQGLAKASQAVDRPPLQPLTLSGHAKSASMPRSEATMLSSDLADSSSVSSRTTMQPPMTHEPPPRRDLPFERPDSRRSDSRGGSSRPGSVALNLPPLRRPSITRQPSDHSMSSRPTSRIENSGTLRLADDLPSDYRIRAQTAPGHGVSFPAKEPISASSNVAQGGSSNIQPPPKPLPPTNWTHSLRVARQVTLSDAPHDTSPPQSAPSTTNVPLSHLSAQLPLHQSTAHVPQDDSVMQDIATSSKFVDSLQTSTQPEQHSSSLSAYAAQSVEDRLAILDEFMVARLNDPAFVTLCEDVENCWRRIALGL